MEIHSFDGITTEDQTLNCLVTGQCQTYSDKYLILNVFHFLLSVSNEANKGKNGKL